MTVERKTEEALTAENIFIYGMCVCGVEEEEKKKKKIKQIGFCQGENFLVEYEREASLKLHCREISGFLSLLKLYNF